MSVRFGLRAWILALALAAIPATALAAIDSYIWLDGMQGEAKSPGHEGAFEIKDFSISAERSTSIGSATSGAGAGKASLHDFTITKTVDRASPMFQRAATNGEHFAQVRVEMRKAGGDPGRQLMTYTFKDVMVTRVQMGRSGDEGPEESITFVYGGMTVQYSGQNDNRLTNRPTVGVQRLAP